MSLTNRDKVLLLIIASVLTVLLGYNFIITPAEAEISKLTERIYEYQNLMVDKVPLVEKLQAKEGENNALTEQMKTMREGDGKALKQQEFLVFLSGVCVSNNVDIIRFSDLGYTQDEYVCKSDFDFELRGDMDSINAVCADINSIGIRYSVSSVSLRQDKELPYLERVFDSLTNLEWYAKESIEDSNAMRLCLTLEFISYEAVL